MLGGLFSNKGADGDQFLIVGLGNPGKEYQNNRHNIGFMAVDLFVKDFNAGPFKSKFQGVFSQGKIDGTKVIYLKPQIYMNNSGQSVGATAKFFKIPPERIIVLYDELDLPPGKVKVKQGGGHGGHNGIKSLDKHLPSKEYWRVRMGIGHPGSKERVSGYVLSDFAKAEAQMLEDTLYYTSKYFPLFIEGKEADFMTRHAEAMKA